MLPAPAHTNNDAHFCQVQSVVMHVYSSCTPLKGEKKKKNTESVFNAGVKSVFRKDFAGDL